MKDFTFVFGRDQDVVNGWSSSGGSRGAGGPVPPHPHWPRAYTFYKSVLVLTQIRYLEC